MILYLRRLSATPTLTIKATVQERPAIRLSRLSAATGGIDQSESPSIVCDARIDRERPAGRTGTDCRLSRLPEPHTLSRN